MSRFMLDENTDNVILRTKEHGYMFSYSIDQEVAAVYPNRKYLNIDDVSAIKQWCDRVLFLHSEKSIKDQLETGDDSTT